MMPVTICKNCRLYWSRCPQIITFLGKQCNFYCLDWFYYSLTWRKSQWRSMSIKSLTYFSVLVLKMALRKCVWGSVSLLSHFLTPLYPTLSAEAYLLHYYSTLLFNSPPLSLNSVSWFNQTSNHTEIKKKSYVKQFSSCHKCLAYLFKKGLPFPQFVRLKHICTSPDDFEHEVQNMYIDLQQRAYSTSWLDAVLEKVHHMDVSQSSTHSLIKKSSVICITTYWWSGDPHVHSVFSVFFPHFCK